MIFAVCGGDERQVRLARQLMDEGHSARVFALEVAALPTGVRHCETAVQAVRDADCVVLPLPATAKRGYLNAPLATEDHCVGEIFGALSPGQLVCAGMPNAELRMMADSVGARLVDYFAREELLAVNAVATAEGAIGVLLDDMDSVLWKKRALVMGWGRLGKAVAPRLKGLGMSVAVSARNEGDMAWIESFGFDALDTRSLGGEMGQFDLVVNTIPAPVLTAGKLAELEPDSVIIDLASKPGGTDFEAARAFGLRAIHALSLPGRWAPETAADAIRMALYNIIEEVKA